MSRYAEAVARIAARIDDRPGIHAIYVSPTDGETIARLLMAALPTAQRLADAPDPWVEAPPLTIAAAWPMADEAAASAFRALNERRDWLKRRGAVVILVLEPRAARAFRRHAPDVASVVRLSEDVRFEPDPSVTIDEGRAAMAAWLDRTMGRLDLRGFLRSEQEDVAFRVTDIYQDVKGTVDGARAPESVEVILGREPGQYVVLGQPGSGKSFFLRWLALQAVARPELLGRDALLPVLVSLPLLASAWGERPLLEALEEWVLEEVPAAGHVLRRMVSEGRALFLFDGLDEVGDMTLRLRAATRLTALLQAAPTCRVVVTSRVAGYGDAPLELPSVVLSPLDDTAVGALLVRWMRLYFVESGRDAKEGEVEGWKVAKDVRGNPQILDLARSPLLLTVLAVIHRAGLRLPDQRAELYAHVTQVLVERWNRVRTKTPAAAPSLRAADAVRLLGPVALALVQGGGRGAVSEERLRGLLQRELKSGSVAGVESADQAIELFKRTLGLIVEQSPGMFTFLHLTFVEYFAARELIRTGVLEEIAKDAARVFSPELREVLLLAAGELGVVRVDDARLAAFVRAVARAATVAALSVTVPSLLTGLLADDPALDAASADELAAALVPRHWFQGEFERRVGPMFETWLVADRLRRGRWRVLLSRRVADHYEKPLDGRALLAGRPYRSGETMLPVLRRLGCDDGFVGEALLRWGGVGSEGGLEIGSFAFEPDGRVQFAFSRWLYHHACTSADEYGFELTVMRIPSSEVVVASFLNVRAAELLAEHQNSVSLRLDFPSRFEPAVVIFLHFVLRRWKPV